MYMMSSATPISATQHTVESEMETPPTSAVQKMRRQTAMKAAIFQSGPQEPRWPVHQIVSVTPSCAGASVMPSSSGRRLLAWCSARMETRGRAATGMATIWAGT